MGDRLGALLRDAAQRRARRGRCGRQLIEDDDLLVLLNADHEPQLFKLPPVEQSAVWQAVIDTSLGESNPEIGEYRMAPRSIVLLRRPRSQS